MRCRGENLLLPLPGHEVGCEPCRFVWGFGKERERGVVGEKISFFPCLCTSRGRRRCTVSFKTTPFSLFLFLTVDETTSFLTKRFVSFKWKWRQISQFPNQSYIFYLFNQVLICNFDFKNRFNCIFAKIKCQPWRWPFFSFWSLVLNLCILTLNWSINFWFLHFSPWFGQFHSLCNNPTFQAQNNSKLFFCTWHTSCR